MAKKAAPTPPASESGEAAPKLTKTAAMRQVLAENPDLSNPEIAGLVLSRFGLTVTPNDVSMRKSLDKKAAAEAAGTPKAPKATRQSSAALTPPPAPSPTGAVGGLADAVQSIKALTEKFGADEVSRLAQMFAK